MLPALQAVRVLTLACRSSSQVRGQFIHHAGPKHVAGLAHLLPAHYLTYSLFEAYVSLACTLTGARFVSGEAHAQTRSRSGSLESRSQHQQVGHAQRLLWAPGLLSHAYPLLVQLLFSLRLWSHGSEETLSQVLVGLGRFTESNWGLVQAFVSAAHVIRCFHLYLPPVPPQSAEDDSVEWETKFKERSECACSSLVMLALRSLPYFPAFQRRLLLRLIRILVQPPKLALPSKLVKQVENYSTTGIRFGSEPGVTDCEEFDHWDKVGLRNARRRLDANLRCLVASLRGNQPLHAEAAAARDSQKDISIAKDSSDTLALAECLYAVAQGLSWDVNVVTATDRPVDAVEHRPASNLLPVVADVFVALLGPNCKSPQYAFPLALPVWPLMGHDDEAVRLAGIKLLHLFVCMVRRDAEGRPLIAERKEGRGNGTILRGSSGWLERAEESSTQVLAPFEPGACTLLQRLILLPQQLTEDVYKHFLGMVVEVERPSRVRGPPDPAFTDATRGHYQAILPLAYPYKIQHPELLEALLPHIGKGSLNLQQVILTDLCVLLGVHATYSNEERSLYAPILAHNRACLGSSPQLFQTIWSLLVATFETHIPMRTETEEVKMEGNDHRERDLKTLATLLTADPEEYANGANGSLGLEHRGTRDRDGLATLLSDVLGRLLSQAQGQARHEALTMLLCAAAPRRHVEAVYLLCGLKDSSKPLKCNIPQVHGRLLRHVLWSILNG